MPLTPKDDVDESRVASKQLDDEAIEELRQRVDDLEERTEVPYGLDSLEELAEGQSAMRDSIDERVAGLENRVDRQETIIRELIQLVEYLGAAADGNGFERGFRAVEEAGSDGYPWTWDGETLEFKAEKFE
jgi:uncharacterized coiled-coil protein SlyX